MDIALACGYLLALQQRLCLVNPVKMLEAAPYLIPEQSQRLRVGTSPEDSMRKRCDCPQPLQCV